MFVVRYVALAALVLWLGGMIAVLLAGAGADAVARAAHRTGLISGSAVLVALFAMKFLGPPPHAFPLRAAAVAAMLAITIAAATTGSRELARALTAVNVAGGFALLTFYARE